MILRVLDVPHPRLLLLDRLGAVVCAVVEVIIVVFFWPLEIDKFEELVKKFGCPFL